MLTSKHSLKPARRAHRITDITNGILGMALLIGIALAGCAFSPANRVQQRIAENGLSTSLDLSDMRLTEIPPEVCTLTHLTNLSLSDNRLTSLPPEISALTNLTWLDISYNDLTTLPPEIEQLTNLETLHVRHNALTALPPEIGDLTQLKILNAAENELTALPPAVGALDQLERLILFENHLTALPESVWALPNLEELALEYNQLTALPISAPVWARLEKLRLTGNPIYTLPPVVERRVEEGALVLEHDPDKRQPKVYVNPGVVCAGGTVLMFISAHALNIGWGKHRRKLAARLQAEGAVYVVPPFARYATLLVLLLTAYITIPLTASALWTWRQGETSLGYALLLPVILSPAWLTALAMLVHNSGIVLMTEEAIALYRPWRTRRVAYDAITGIKEDAPGIPPTLVVRGRAATLRIPRSVEGYVDLHARLRHDTGAPHPEAQPAAALPLRLRITPKARRFNRTGALVLTLLTLGVLFLIWWLPRAQGDVPPYTTNAVINAVALALFISALFIPAIVIFLLDIDPRSPVALDITATGIRYCYRGNRCYLRPLDDLHTIAIQVVQKARRSRISGVTIYSKPWISPLTLRFKDGSGVTFSPARMWQFGYSRERLYTVLAQLLPDKEGIVEKI